MAMTDNLPPVVKSLWDLENDLRSAAQNAVFMRKDEASRHLDEAKRHLQEALNAMKSGAAAQSPAVNGNTPNELK